jgi:hypothetical protein
VDKAERRAPKAGEAVASRKRKTETEKAWTKLCDALAIFFSTQGLLTTNIAKPQIHPLLPEASDDRYLFGVTVTAKDLRVEAEKVKEAQS